MANAFDVIVIGGGAAGMMAAGQAANRGRKVLVLEKNRRVGAKLSITGGGRCNITNAQDDVHLLLAHYGDGGKFLYSPFSQFGVKDTFSFFTGLGLPLIVQANNRAFPNTEKALDVVRVFEKYLKAQNVTVRTEVEVDKFVFQNGQIVGVRIGNEVLSAASYILATGGKSHPETGSTGDGFGWLADLGHTVKEPTPTIVPLAVSDHWIKSLAGVSLGDIKISFFTEGIKKLSLKGRMLCTHFGISGPLILNAAGKVSDMLHDGVVTATIDVHPTLDLGALDKLVTKTFDQNKNKAFKNVMKVVVPTGTSSAILGLLPPAMGDTKVHSISKEDRKTFVHLLKALPLTITGLMGYERAVVADGGVSISEIDGKTMRSRKHPNLFVTGDLLHISRPSGGYSLQLCWTTGWVAGNWA